MYQSVFARDISLCQYVSGLSVKAMSLCQPDRGISQSVSVMGRSLCQSEVCCLCQSKV